METESMTEKARYIPAVDVRQRYGNVCAKTIKRWVEKGVLPPPIKFTGSQFAPDMFLVSELDEYDQRRLAQRGKPGRKPKGAVAKTRATNDASSITSDEDRAT